MYCVWYENNYIMDIVNVSKFVSYIKPLRIVASQTSAWLSDSRNLLRHPQFAGASAATGRALRQMIVSNS